MDYIMILRCVGVYSLAMVACVMVSCSSLPSFGPDQTLEEKFKEEQRKKNEGVAAYQQAGGRFGGFDESDIITTAGVSQRQNTAFTGVTKAEDVVWAPEDPNEAMGAGIEEVWKNPESHYWHKDFSVAGKKARNTGKPILLWFTDSESSPVCKKLNQELILTPDFEAWAKENTVRVTLDIAEGKDDAARYQYIKKYQKRFNVLGNPSMYVLSTSGNVVSKQRGYKQGDALFYWGRIKQAVSVAAKQHGAWREKMEKRGYRMWTSRGGSKVFAKLYRFQPDRITLIEPTGKRGTTPFNKLSDADQAWVLAQKKKYDDARGG